MAQSTTISRRTVTIKGGKARLPKASMAQGGTGEFRPLRAAGPRSGRRLVAAPKRSTRWWRQPELYIAIGISLAVIVGLTYISMTARPNTGYPQDEFVAGSGTGTTVGTEGRNQVTSQDRLASDQSFLAFARAQRAKSEAAKGFNGGR